MEDDYILGESPRGAGDVSTCHRIIFHILFFILGVINNLGYVLILTGSYQLAERLDNNNMIALYLLSLIICSSLSRVVNSTLFIRVSYRKRVVGLSLYFFIAYLSLFLILNGVDKNTDFDKLAAFLLTLIPSFIMGTGSAFGEATLLGYLRIFPKDFVSGWSSGTGLAGVLGALITLMFKIFQVKTKLLYIIVSPVCFIYALAFFISDRMYTRYLSNMESGVIEVDAGRSDVSENKEMNYENFVRAFKRGSRFIVNLAVVYFLEYVILTGFSERVTKYNYVKDENLQNNLYEIFSLCYQVGVLISRSSLFLVKYITFVECFTIVQSLNFLLWILEVYFGFISNGYVLFCHLIIVGLCGGGAYVACFFFILNSLSIESNYKELCVNIATIFNDLGILGASLTVLIFDNTIMK